MNLERVWAKSLVPVVLVAMLSAIPVTVLRAQASDPFPVVAAQGRAARRISASTVPAIRKIVNDGDALLAQASATGNPTLAHLASRLSDQAIKLARVELVLRRRLRQTLRKLQRVRVRLPRSPQRGSVNVIRQAEAALQSIRQQQAFLQLKHGFIRRTLRLVDQRLREGLRSIPADADELDGDFKGFETRFARLQQSVRQAGNGAWTKLRRADNTYRRALVAKRAEQFDSAGRLIDDALQLLDDVAEELDKAGKHQARGEDRGGAVLGSPARTASTNRAIERTENLRRSVAPKVANNAIARALVLRADRLVVEARRALARGNGRIAVEKVALAERLYKRAFAEVDRPVETAPRRQ